MVTKGEAWHTVFACARLYSDILIKGLKLKPLKVLIARTRNICHAAFFC
jgi:hypothetical protein